MKVLTIGFTQKSAEEFFGLLLDAGVKTVIDIRLRNTSQLSGFAKRDDIRFFLKELGNIGYVHEPLLAPTAGMFDEYKKGRISWDNYESRFLQLMREREIVSKLDKSIYDQACLLCSEHQPEQCHRRLVAEYLNEHWENVEVIHLI